MKRFAWVSIAQGLALAIESAAPGIAHASDRELQAILDRQACVPVYIMSTEVSAKAKLYEVTCKGMGRALEVICLESECRLQARPRENDDK